MWPLRDQPVNCHVSKNKLDVLVKISKTAVIGISETKLRKAMTEYKV